MAGLFFEEFYDGQTFKHAITRTITETDNVLFSAMTHNPQPLHLDAEFAKTTEFGRQIVNSIFTMGLMIGVSVGDTTLGTTVANLGMNDVRFAQPVFHRRYAPLRKQGHREAREQVAPGRRHRGVRASIVQPARRSKWRTASARR